MKKIVCESCENRAGDYGIYIVYDAVVICGTCRLATINYLRGLGIGFDNPFVLQFSTMERGGCRVRVGN